MKTGRVWRVVVLAPCDWVTDNYRGHFMAKAKLVAQWRACAAQNGLYAKLPTRIENLVDIEAVARFLGRPVVRDRNNLRATLKAVVDGLGPAKGGAPGCGFLIDDNDHRVRHQNVTIGDPLNPATARPGHPGLLDLTITEILI